jgi:hypothetical protein
MCVRHEIPLPPLPHHSYDNTNKKQTKRTNTDERRKKQKKANKQNHVQATSFIGFVSMLHWTNQKRFMILRARSPFPPPSLATNTNTPPQHGCDAKHNNQTLKQVKEVRKQHENEETKREQKSKI